MGAVKVSYTAPTESGAKLRDAEGNNVADLMDPKVLNICSRTEAVRDEILDQITRTVSCNEVTGDDLSEITTLDLGREDITELRSGDFNGLTSLQTLYLGNNSLTDLPQDLFDGLTSLWDLGLNGNSLTSLHEDLFDGLTSLQTLRLARNSLTSLHPDLFDGLTSLQTLRLGGNPLTCVPAKIFNQAGINIAPFFILAACPDPIVTLSVSPSTIGEEDEATEVTVTGTLNILQATATPVTVSVGSGTATAGTDFTAVSDFTISIPANILSATETFTLTPTSDTVHEPDETLMITGTSTVEGVTVNGTLLTLTDDDTPTVTLHLSSTSIGEDGESSTVTATLNYPSSEEATITISVAPTSPATASDYTLSGSTLTIAAGATESTETVTITAVDNLLITTDKILTVQGTASNPLGINGPADVELTIMNPPTVSSATVDGTTLVVNFNESLASVNGLTNSAFTVKKTPSGGSEEDQALSGTPIVSGETVTLTLSSPVIASDMGTVKVSYMAPTEPSAKLRDAEGNNVVDFVDLGVLNLRGGICSRTDVVRDAILGQITRTTFCYEVTSDDLSHITDLNITGMGITELRSGDFNGLTSLQTLYLGNNSLSDLPQDLFDGLTSLWDLGLNGNSLTSLHEDLFDGLTSLQTLRLARNSLTSLHPDLFDGLTSLQTLWLVGNPLTCVPAKIFNRAGITINPSTLTACPDPSITLSLNPSTIGEEDEATEVTVTGTLNILQATATPVTVSVGSGTATTGTDFTAVSDFTISIPANILSATETFTLTPTSDTVHEPDETVMITGTSTVEGVTVNGTLLTLTDDDTPTVTLNLSSTSIGEDGESSTVTATLNYPSSEETTITISVAPTSPATASDYTLSGSTLTIAAGATESTETVTITAVDNLLITTDKILTVQGTASNPLGINGPADVELTITTPPTVSSATVDGTTLVVNFNESLASVSGLTNSAFTVKKTPSGGSEEDQALTGTPIVSGETVTLTLSSPVIASDMGTVKVSYMAPTEPSAKLRDAEGNNVVDFVDLGVLNLRGGICSRTDAVRDAILNRITRTTFCYEVTSDDLSNITIFNFVGITELRSGDFNGLTSLRRLSLDGNALTDLHQDLFDELTNLQILQLSNNSLTDLHQDLFDGLTNLQYLYLGNNSLSSLHPDLFDGLTNLQYLYLDNNSLSSLHPDLFDGLTSLSELSIAGNNDLTDLHQDLFDGLSNLVDLNLNSNSLTSLHEDLFDGLTSLQTLRLANNSLSSLHPDLFDGLTSLQNLQLAGNPLTCVPAKIFNRVGISINPSTLAACPDPSITLSLNPSSIGEEDEATEVTVTGTLNILQATALPVTVSVGSGTATAGTDFTAVSDVTISIPPNNLSATGTFTLTPTSDIVDEPDETVIITGTSTVENVTVNGTPLTITDDNDAPTVTLRLSPISIPENAGSSTVTAMLNYPSSEETTITISVAPTSPATASDYTLSGSTLTIAAGTTESTETVTITAVDNLLITTDKILTVQGTASNPLGINGPADVELTITNPPMASSATVDGTTLVVNFDEELASVSGLTNSAFTVKKTPSGGSEEDQALTGTPTVSRKTVILTLGSPVIASDMGTVKVSYMAPTEPSAKLRDAEGNHVMDFMDLGVLNLRGGICSRTDAVRDAILNQITRTAFCYEVTSDELSTITSLSFEGRNITELRAGDFNGLTSLTELDLYTNALTDLHEDLFDGLTNLQALYLSKNDLTDLHEDLFDGLTSLSTLGLAENSLTSLHEDLFDGLTNLGTLYLSNNSLESLHEDLFDGLTSLSTLGLFANSLPSLHPDLFDGLTNLETLALGANPLICVPPKIFNKENVTIYPLSLAACPDPSITLSLNPSTIGEEDEATEVTVTGTLNILQATATPVTVSVGSGTATAGTDFTAVSDFTISIPGNNLSATGTFTLTPTSDTVHEPDETLMITGTSTVEGVTVNGTPLTITDDDTPTVTLQLSPSSIGEDGESSTVTATLNHPSSEETTITISVAPTSPATASDYTLSGSTLTIAAGATESTETVTITAVDNLLITTDKILTVQGTASNALGINGPAGVELTITTPPTVSSATVDGTTLVVNFNESLASVSGLTNSAFTVKKTPSGGSEEDQALSGTPIVSGETVTLTLSSPVIASDMGTVKVSYMAPTEPSAKLRDAEGNNVVDFMDLGVLNLRGGICSRTDVVRDAILRQITRTTFCYEVTSDDLGNVRSLNTLNEGITELRAGDFNGLTSLTRLELENNDLTDLHQDLFNGLTSLRTLYLYNNDLTDLHQDLFDGLTSLQEIWLEDNSLTDLHQDLFDGLINLGELDLNNNSLTSLHPDLFDDVDADRFTVSLEENELTCVPSQNI